MRRERLYYLHMGCGESLCGAVSPKAVRHKPINRPACKPHKTPRKPAWPGK